MTKKHCWHWGEPVDGVEKEKCCQCERVIDERDRWLTDTGECDWTTKWDPE